MIPFSGDTESGSPGLLKGRSTPRMRIRAGFLYQPPTCGENHLNCLKTRKMSKIYEVAKGLWDFRDLIGNNDLGRPKIAKPQNLWGAYDVGKKVGNHIILGRHDSSLVNFGGTNK